MQIKFKFKELEISPFEKETLSTVPVFEPGSFDCRSTALPMEVKSASFSIQKDFKFFKFEYRKYPVLSTLLFLLNFIIAHIKFHIPPISNLDMNFGLLNEQIFSVCNKKVL